LCYSYSNLLAPVWHYLQQLLDPLLVVVLAQVHDQIIVDHIVVLVLVDVGHHYLLD